MVLWDAWHPLTAVGQQFFLKKLPPEFLALESFFCKCVLLVHCFRHSSIFPSFSANELLSALKCMQADDPSRIPEDLMKAAMEGVLKELQWFPDDIRKKMDEVSEREGCR